MENRKNMAERVVNVDEIEHMINLFGSYDENIEALQSEYGVTVVNRDGDIRISGGEARGRRGGHRLPLRHQRDL